MRSVKNGSQARAASPSGIFAGGLSTFDWLDSAIRLVPEPQPASIFDGARNVYLSPHHDDVCFSLGGLAAQQPGGRMVSLFTRSAYAPSPPAGTKPAAEAVTKLRAEEDNAFAAFCGLTKLDLGLTDAPLLGRRSMDLTRLQEDRATLKGPLLACLRGIAVDAGSRGDLTLFCPAGIGGHVNHVATMQTVIELLPIVQRHYRVLFYEDLHYAANAQKRDQGLLRLFANLNGKRGKRITISFDLVAEAKLAMVRLYKSQFCPGELPENPAGFSPEIPGSNVGLHEAVWDFGLDCTQTRSNEGASR